MRLLGERIYLRDLTVEDAEAMTQLLVKNRTYWGQAEPLRPDHYYTVAYRRESIQQMRFHMECGIEYSFGVYLRDSDILIGEVVLYDVRRGPFQQGSIGFTIDEDIIGFGIATEAADVLVAFAFEQLQLHRLCAEVAADNSASQRVMAKLGFRQEGLARQNVCIQGEWKDHYQYALLVDEWLRKDWLDEEIL